jgi:predicted transcriptional regulator
MMRQSLPECNPLATSLTTNLLGTYLNGNQKGKKMILQNPLPVTEKGLDFLQDYDRIKAFMLEMGLKYLDISEGDL